MNNKKRIKSLSALLMCLVLVFSLCSCGNKLNSIKRSFEKEGFAYTFLATEDEIAETIDRELTEGGYKYETHFFSKVVDSNYASETKAYVMIVEFDSEAELEKAFTSDKPNTLKYLVEDYKNSSFVYGNCVLVIIQDAGLTDINDIFTSTK